MITQVFRRPATVVVGMVTLFAATLGAFAAESFNVRDFGAKGDGRAIDSPAINRAIDAAHTAGGGIVYLSAGTYASYSLRLKDNVTLQFSAGATLLAASPSQGSGYDSAEPNEHTQYQDFGHSHWHNSLIWGEDLEDVAILGPGRIEGTGLSRGEFSAQAGGGLPAGAGNKAIALKNCRNVRLRDFTLSHGGHVAILATGCENLEITGLTIDTNRDGIDLDYCRDARITGCRVNSPDDDGICLKSSYALGKPVPTENVTIERCVVSGYDEGTLLDGTKKAAPCEGLRNGRIKLGTESNGGFRHIRISDCRFEHSKGLALEIVDGGTMEDVIAERLTMDHIESAPIFVCLSGRSRGPGPPPIGTIRNVTIRDVKATDAGALQGMLITGLPSHRIEDVTLENVFIAYAGGGTSEQAKLQMPEREKGYPEPDKFGATPAYGLYARHIDRLVTKNVSFALLAPDQRPPVVMEDVINPIRK